MSIYIDTPMITYAYSWHISWPISGSAQLRRNEAPHESGRPRCSPWKPWPMGGMISGLVMTTITNWNITMLLMEKLTSWAIVNSKRLNDQRV